MTNCAKLFDLPKCREVLLLRDFPCDLPYGAFCATRANDWLYRLAVEAVVEAVRHNSSSIPSLDFKDFVVVCSILDTMAECRLETVHGFGFHGYDRGLSWSVYVSCWDLVKVSDLLYDAYGRR